MSKKLLLISANSFDVPYPVYPLGLSYLSTYLENNLPDLQIHIFDIYKKNNTQMLNIITDYNPDFIGISMRNVDDVNSLKTNVFVNEVKEIIDNIRLSCKAVIILGGSGFSIFPQKLFDYLQPDYGIFGEGEKGLKELLLKILPNNKNTKLDRNTLDEINGLVFRNDSEVFVNRNTNNSTDLKLNYNSELLDYYWQQSGMINIQTKRGCPFKCIYCTYPVIEGSNVRCINNDNIIDVIAKLKSNKGYDYFFFTDSVFNIHQNECVDLAEKLVKENLNIKWGAYFSPYRIIKDEMALFKKSGLTHIEFGSDSFSDITLQCYQKPFLFRDILKATEIVNELGIYQSHFLVFNGYGETEKSLNETLKNSRFIKKSVFFPFIGMRIYPGTKLAEYSINVRVINKDDDMINPYYYQSIEINYDNLKQKAKDVGGCWIFPDEDFSAVIKRMRLKNKKGPLWEYLL